MMRLWLLFATIAFSNLFLIYRPEGGVTFVMSGIKSPLDTAIYFTYEHIGQIILAWLILSPPTEHRYMYVLYFVISVIDFFFYLLYYKSPMLWNPLRCVIFGVPLIYETWKSLQRQYHNS